jgi:hypothetical protein
MTLVFILLIRLHTDQDLLLPAERCAENLEHLPNIHLLKCGHYSRHLVLSYAEHSLSHCWPVLLVKLLYLFLARQLPVVQGLLIHEVSRSHTTHHSR